MSTIFPVSGNLGRNFTNKKITVKLDDSNYLIWKQQVYFMAKQHRLFSYLDGSNRVPAPRTRDSTTGLEIENPEFAVYEQLDSALASWLLASVTSSVLPDLVGLETAAQIWNAYILISQIQRSCTIRIY
ncbi:hypothetical protein QN277_028239 [Acacia crassicarpa]|uniref:Retrotransposon Copia-like N-terminal domain-containing protein n=1 Tax=Acacia crassicarpa TaxID=499986 RepID=A0AAE1J5D1_9FABA|nr:hypothetical protein QN277_028239 [Acacia crassicarpa]